MADEEFPGQDFNHLIHDVNALEMKYIGNFSKCATIKEEWVSDNLWLANYKVVKKSILQSYEKDDHIVWRRDDYVIKMQPILFSIYGESSNDDNFNEVIHEAAVGSILNTMNNKHFARIVCHDFCHTCIPNLLEDEKRYNRCAYVIYRFVPGISLDQYIETCSEIQLCSVLHQLFSALCVAYERFNFTHYDLHLKNIIVNNSIDIKPYPIIIDYGSSYIDLELGGEIYSFGRELKAGSIYRRPCWHHDVFKVCMWIYNALKPELVIERIRKELYNRITDLRIIMSDMKNRIYPSWHIKNIQDQLKKDKLAKTIGLDIKLAKIQARNQIYRERMLKASIELQQREALLKMLDTDPYSVISHTPFSCCSKLEKLISYFTGIKTDCNWFRNYCRTQRYMQLDDKMAQNYYDFPEFLRYSAKVLDITKKV